MTTRPGYFVTATFFLPADPQDAGQMALAAGFLNDLAMRIESDASQQLQHDLDVDVSYRFVARHKSPAPPAAPTAADPSQAAGEADKPAVACQRCGALTSADRQGCQLEECRLEMINAEDAGEPPAGGGDDPLAIPPFLRRQRAATA